MGLTEKERLLLLQKMGEISRLTTEILDIENDLGQIMEIKKRMNGFARANNIGFSLGHK